MKAPANERRSLYTRVAALASVIPSPMERLLEILRRGPRL